jgi:hypothetical protein
MLALLYSLSQGQALKLSGAPLYRLKSAGATAASTVVVGGFVTRSLSLSPFVLPCMLHVQNGCRAFCLFNQTPPTTTIFFFFSSILGSSILHTVARLCLSLAPLTFLFLNHLLQSLHPARPKWRCSVWGRKEYRYIVRRIGTRDFFFLASNFLDLGMKYKMQERKKKESEIKQKRKNEEKEECSLEEWGGALCDG